MFQSLKYEWLVVGLLLIVVGCAEIKEKQEGVECKNDNDCGVGGCSGQICAMKDKAKEIITTCEMKPEYECLQKTSCDCVSGRCNWKETQLYKECIGKIRVGEDATPV